MPVFSLACGAWPGRRYECKGCTAANKDKTDDERTTQSFNAWDPAVLARMDDFVSRDFPFILTKKAAICKSVVDRLADDLLEGKGFAAVSKSLAKAYSTRYFGQMRSYVSLAKRGIAKLGALWSQNADNAAVPKFSGTSIVPTSRLASWKGKQCIARPRVSWSRTTKTSSLSARTLKLR